MGGRAYQTRGPCLAFPQLRAHGRKRAEMDGGLSSFTPISPISSCKRIRYGAGGGGEGGGSFLTVL